MTIITVIEAICKRVERVIVVLKSNSLYDLKLEILIVTQDKITISTL